MADEDKSVNIETKVSDEKPMKHSRLKRIRQKIKPQEFNMKSLWLSLVAVLVGLAIFTTIFGVLIYRYKSESALVYSVSKYIPYPVMQVNGRFVSYHEYVFEVNSIKHYYANQPGQDG